MHDPGKGIQGQWEVCVKEQDALYVLRPVCNVIQMHGPWKGDARPWEGYAGPMEVCVKEQDALYLSLIHI